METQSLFQDYDGGSIPTSALKENKFRVEPVTFQRISALLRECHYKGDHIGGDILCCLALKYGMRIIGGAVVGPPRHSGPYSSGGKLKVMEIRRMVCLEIAPKNTESYFLSKVIWYLRRHNDCDRVLSYADGTVGHVGTIYAAANFRKIGETDATMHVFWRGKRYHPRSLSIDRPYSYELREAVKRGDAVTEIGKPKSVWIYDIARQQAKEGK